MKSFYSGALSFVCKFDSSLHSVLLLFVCSLCSNFSCIIINYYKILWISFFFVFSFYDLLL